MKILHINGNYLDSNLHQLMVSNLDSSIISSFVFVPIRKKVKNNVKLNSNVNVKICFNKKDRLFFYLKQLKIYKSIERDYNLTDFDCIHSYTLFTDGNVANKIYENCGIPYVVAIRNTDVNIFFKYMIFLRRKGIKILNESQAIVFLSDTYKNTIFEKYIPNWCKEALLEKTYIIPNGIDDYWHNNRVFRNKTSFENKQLNLLFVGKVNKNKNIVTIQKSIQNLSNDGYKVKLTIVGSIEDQNLYKKLKVDKNLNFIPRQCKTDLIKIYRSNDIFIMPSLTETFGLVYVEAMSQGLPIIYSKGQGFDNQFKNGQVGYSVNSKNSEEIAIAIKKILNNYAEISNNCSIGSTKFKWSIINQEYSKIYNDCSKRTISKDS